MGLVPAACDRVGETTGGAAHDERRDQRVSLCRVGLAPTASLMRRNDWLIAWSGCGGWFEWCSGSVGGDGWVPCLAGGDHRVQMPQNRRGDHGLRLGGAQLVVLTRGQMCISGRVNG